MTAREELREMLDSLTEEEAAACVKAVEERREPEQPRKQPQYGITIRPGKSREEQLPFLRRLADSEPTMTEEEWETFQREFDSHRPHRPLFT